MITKSGDEYILHSKDGEKILYRSKSLQDVKNREREINYFKYLALKKKRK